MKYLVLTLLLASCAKAPDDSAPVSSVAASKSAAAAAASLAHTEKLDEATAISAAAASALGGEESFPAATALRCWQREEARPHVREACLLAWAAAGRDSPELRSALHQALKSPTRAYTIAAARRRGFVKELTQGELLSLISSLAGEPSWVRAEVALTWLETSQPASLIEAGQLLSSLALPETDGSPYAMLTKFAVSRRLGLEKEAAWLRIGYCSPSASGPAATRCLRLLSALMDARFADFSAVVQANLPARKDAGTLLFQRSFPTRAHAFDNLY